MKIMSTDLKELGASSTKSSPNPTAAPTATTMRRKIFGDTLERSSSSLNQGIKELLHSRYQKFRHMCQFFDLGG